MTMGAKCALVLMRHGCRHDHAGPHSEQFKTGNVTLGAGSYAIRIDYYQVSVVVCVESLSYDSSQLPRLFWFNACG